jgi:acyl-CoA dehydrogenase
VDLGITPKLAAAAGKSQSLSPKKWYPWKGLRDEIDTGDRWGFTERQTEIIETLKSKARAEGLWNFFLTEGEHSSGLSTVEYAYLAEAMGRSHLAPEVFNCAAPDTGNMEVLVKYGSEAQKERVAEAAARRRDPQRLRHDRAGVASSDATNISTSAVLMATSG